MIYYIFAMALDLLIGDPYNFPHPIRLIGSFINSTEKLIRRFAKTRRELKIGGILLLVATTIFSALIVYIPLFILNKLGKVFYIIVLVYFSYTIVSTRSLIDESIKVKRALNENLETGRDRVGHIVSRDTSELDNEGVVKATIETVAENTTDGVIAPLLYLFMGGPVLAMAYKGVNTLDSMVGYKNDLYIDLGWASAKFDDILNFIPARLAALIMVASAFILKYDYKRAFLTMLKDHDKHESPNSAWTEAVASGALNIQLGGTHIYYGKKVYKPTIGRKIRSADTGDITKANKLMFFTFFIFVIFYATIYLSLKLI